MEYKSIIRKIQDMAGKIRVFVDVGEEEAIMLKFEKDPTIQQIKNEIEKRIQMTQQVKINKLEQVKQQIQVLTDRKNQLETEIK